MKKTAGILLVIIATSLFSCKNKEKEAQLTRVDSLFTVLKAIEVKVLGIDTMDYNKRIAYSDEKMNFIQENYKDTATKEQAIFLSDIVANKRSFSKLMRKREEVIDELLYTKSQLTDLKKDVNNNKVLKNSFNEYLVSEANAVNDLSKTADGLISWGESTTARHEKMKPQIEEFITNIDK